MRLSLSHESARICPGSVSLDEIWPLSSNIYRHPWSLSVIAEDLLGRQQRWEGLPNLKDCPHSSFMVFSSKELFAKFIIFSFVTHINSEERDDRA